MNITELDALIHDFGGVRHDAGFWTVFGNTVSYRRVLHIHSETGWHRWRLPSIDGQVRPRDRDAPTVMLSPTGAVIWTRKTRSRLVTDTELEQALIRYAKSVFKPSHV